MAWFPKRELWDAQFNTFLETCTVVPFSKIEAWVTAKKGPCHLEAIVDGTVHVELRRSIFRSSIDEEIVIDDVAFGGSILSQHYALITEWIRPIDELAELPGDKTTHEVSLQSALTCTDKSVAYVWGSYGLAFGVLLAS